MSRVERYQKQYRRRSRVRKAADIVILLCLMAIIGFSGSKIYVISREYRESQDKYDEIAKTGKDFEALSEINKDVVGWIECENTIIDYPVVQGSDNEKYLTTMFDNTWSGFGTLFVDYITKKPFKQFNTVIYGHHMRNGSMFAGLGDFKDEEYAKSHPFKLYTPDGDYDLTVWAFCNVPADSTLYATNLTGEEIPKYIREVNREAEYTTNVEVDEDSTTVILSTCAYEWDGARYMVFCKATPVPEGEPEPQEKLSKWELFKVSLKIFWQRLGIPL